MNETKAINELWQQLEKLIGEAYRKGGKYAGALRDFQEDQHDLVKLLQEETANERQHRRGWPNGSRAHLSAYVAAKLLLLGNFTRGAEVAEAPPAAHFLMYRETAMKMETIGYLCRAVVTPEFRAAVAKFDYADLMNSSEVKQ